MVREDSVVFLRLTDCRVKRGRDRKKDRERECVLNYRKSGQEKIL